MIKIYLNKKIFLIDYNYLMKYFDVMIENYDHQIQNKIKNDKMMDHKSMVVEENRLKK